MPEMNRLPFSLLLLFILQFAQAQDCTEDCVWPGDANQNGITNNMDVLALGLGFDAMGPERIPSTVFWEGQDAPDWPQSLPVSGVNFKHIDANGDGSISENDFFPIGNNFNITNDLFDGLMGIEIPGDDLFLEIPATDYAPGDTISVIVHLGSEENPIEDIYGIAFSIQLDTQYISEIIEIDFTNNWLTADQNPPIHFDKYLPGLMDEVQFTTSRSDQSTTSGFGELLRFDIVIVDDIIAIIQDPTICLPFPLLIERVMGINNNEEDLMITSQNDSLQLKHPTQIMNLERSLPGDISLEVFPNPATDVIEVQTRETEITGWALVTPSGTVQSQQQFITSSRQSFHILLHDGVAAGLYTLVIYTETGIFRRPVVITP
jgi:hypothetical protein